VLEKLLWLIVATYGFVPSFWERIFSKKVIKHTPKSNQIALTFDDGPDLYYTKDLLRVLAEEQVSATFFVVASKAAQYPDIIKQIISQGHEIALHSYKHTCQWFLSPKATQKDFEKSLDILKDLGVVPHFFRPPWGLFNLFTRYYSSKFRLNLVYWSTHVYDWSKYNDSHKMVNDLRQIKGGEIILLHDSSAAPMNTINSMSEIISDFKDRGLQFVTLRECTDLYDD